MFAIMFEIKMYLEIPEEDKNLSQSIKFFFNSILFPGYLKKLANQVQISKPEECTLINL